MGVETGLELVSGQEPAIADPFHEGYGQLEMELEQECWTRGATRACCRWRNAVVQIGWMIKIPCPDVNW